jgi:ketosteroid isomerase-like protein
MGKVLTFEDFSKINHVGVTLEGHTPDTDLKHYMFFQNLSTIKHYLDEIMKMDRSEVDALLANGHDWAVDHVSTSTDDIAEVTNWLRGEIEMGGGSEKAGTDYLANFNLDTQTGDVIDNRTGEIVFSMGDDSEETGTDYLANFNLDTQTGDVIDNRTGEIVFSKGSDVNKPEIDMIDDEKEEDEDEKEEGDEE